jgi:L-threonylcarbamoyladenylate synthase
MSGTRVRVVDFGNRDRSVALAQAALRRGELVMLPLDTQYALVGDAFRAEALGRLRRARERPADWAPPLVVPSVAALGGIAHVEGPVQELARAFWPGMLSLVCDPQPSLTWELGDTRRGVVVRMPLHPVALEVLAEVGPCAAVVLGTAVGREPGTASEALGPSAIELHVGGLPVGRSTVLDVRSWPPRLLRDGDVPLAELRAVVPSITAASG